MTFPETSWLFIGKDNHLLSRNRMVTILFLDYSSSFQIETIQRLIITNKGGRKAFFVMQDFLMNLKTFFKHLLTNR